MAAVDFWFTEAVRRPHLTRPEGRRVCADQRAKPCEILGIVTNLSPVPSFPVLVSALLAVPPGPLGCCGQPPRGPRSSDTPNCFLGCGLGFFPDLVQYSDPVLRNYCCFRRTPTSARLRLARGYFRTRYRNAGRSIADLLAVRWREEGVRCSKLLQRQVTFSWDRPSRAPFCPILKGPLPGSKLRPAGVRGCQRLASLHRTPASLPLAGARRSFQVTSRGGHTRRGSLCCLNGSRSVSS